MLLSSITAVPSLSSLNLVPIPFNFHVNVFRDPDHSRTLPLSNVFLSGLRSAADLSERPYHQTSHDYVFSNSLVKYELNSLQDFESHVPHNNERASQIWTIGMAVTRMYETGYGREAVAHASLGEHDLWHLSVDNTLPPGDDEGPSLPPSPTTMTASASAPASAIPLNAVLRRQQGAAANGNEKSTLSWMPPDNFHLEHCLPIAGHIDARAALPLLMGYMMVYAAPLGPETVIHHADYRVRGLRLTFTATARYPMEVKHTNWAVQELGRQYLGGLRSGGLACEMIFHGQVGSLTIGLA
ncbi:MAG: hypothetical protein LQ342_004325 [Letrouitia transgressa]|nr:MAG: hypothetical protein LQ342_004325 [Letrouitia transgressa]